MDYLEYVTNTIHTVVMATTDDAGLPVTCAIDIMDYDKNGLYFLTAKGKGFYNRLKRNAFVALTGMKGNDTLSCVAVSIRGKVREIGTGRQNVQGYFIDSNCIGCKSCEAVCPQKCIDFGQIPAVIRQENCLHCGNCAAICPQKAVIRRGYEHDAK